MGTKKISNKSAISLMVVAIIGLVVIAGGFLYLMNKQTDLQSNLQASLQAGVPESLVPDTCPDTRVTDFRFRSLNTLNSTADYTPTATMYAYDENGAYVGSVAVTATSTFTSVSPNLPCGKTYTFKTLSSSTTTSDIISTSKGKIVNGDLVLQATMAKEDVTIRLRKKTNALEFRAMDTSYNGIYDDGESDTTSYTEDPTYKTTSSNSSAQAVGANEVYEGYLYVRSTTAFTDFVDRDGKILVDLGASGDTYWNTETASLMLDGVPLGICDLSPNEAKAYSDYELAYCFDGGITRTKRTLYYSFDSTDSNPTNDIKFSFVSSGNFASNKDATTIISDSVEDDTSRTSVHTKEDVTFDLS